MEKRITSIVVNNFKGYYGKYDPLEITNGENVLIYGENGSGKSSLYKALNNFFLSSRDSSVEFLKNKYNDAQPGYIEIQFSDYNPTIKEIIAPTARNYRFADTTSNHGIQFIKDTALIKGFLDYTDLLKVYFHSDPKPNLFELIVLHLLGEHIPVSSGGSFTFRKKWEELQADLIEKPYNRNERTHRRAKNFLPQFETHLRASLDDVFIKLNEYLRTYFPHFDIQLQYTLQPLDFVYEDWYKRSWFTTADLRLEVTKNGHNFTNGYSDFMNEARLSAIAICIYLASLKITNKNFDLRILYLDDVFIGLDSSNRIPVLNILRDDFSEYQKFISTYDRHWFELAKRHFQIYNDESWKYVEMYVGNAITPTGICVNKPIVTIGFSYAEKASKYLHHGTAPDYPAAANYFRKALEELISLEIPEYELVDGDNTRIPEYRLSKLLERCFRALEKTNNDTSFVRIIQGHLYSLLHPLSHHEITSLIYKQELVSIESAYQELRTQLRAIDLKANYRCIQGMGSRLKFQFVIDPVLNHIQNYEFILKEGLLIYKNGAGALEITKSKCWMSYLEGNKSGSCTFQLSPKKDDPRFQYISLNEIVDNTYHHITTKEGHPITKPTNNMDVVEYFDGTDWKPIRNLFVWP